MSSEIIAKNLLPANVQSNRGLINVFNGQKATPQQASDMLAFHTIGVQAYQQYITHRILMQPSPSNAPVRRRKLLTMESLKPTRKKLADQNGIPHKSSKSTWTEKLESRYKTAVPNVVSNHLPEGWTPQAAMHH